MVYEKGMRVWVKYLWLRADFRFWLVWRKKLQFRNDISDFTEHPKIAWDSRWFWLLYHSNFRSCISGKMKQTTTKNGSWSYNERSSGGIFDLEEPSMIIGKNEKLTEKSSPRIYFSVWKNRAGVLSLRKSLRLFTHFATVAAFSWKITGISFFFLY